MTMEEWPSSLWGICVCVCQVHRPEGVVRMLPPEPQQVPNFNPTMDTDAAVVNLKASVVAPPAAQSLTALIDEAARNSATSSSTALTDGGWYVRCSLLGHSFRAELPRGAAIANASKRAARAIASMGAGEAAKAEQDLSDLKGAEAHAYLQCGVSRLRQALVCKGTNGADESILKIELLHPTTWTAANGWQRGGDWARVCYCEVGARCFVQIGAVTTSVLVG